MRLKNNRGVILIMVLWVLFILSSVVLALSRRSMLQADVFETYRGKLRSYAAARAGINYARALMYRSPSTSDSLYRVGIDIKKNETPKDVFGHIAVSEQTYATIAWESRLQHGQAPVLAYGLRDEQGRININAINDQNYFILSCLFEINGVAREEADALSKRIYEYRTTQNAQQSGLKSKYRFFEHPLELLEVSGMTPALFGKIKEDITVYGEPENGLLVNMNTASNDVIEALAKAQDRAGFQGNSDQIAATARDLRDGNDARPFTADDGGVVPEGIDNWPPSLRNMNSYFVRIRSIGIDKPTGIRTVLEAVIRRSRGFSQDQVIAWMRD